MSNIRKGAPKLEIIQPFDDDEAIEEENDNRSFGADAMTLDQV